MRNLEALLRSASMSHRTILEVLPEMHAGASVLRNAFASAPGGDSATFAVSQYGGLRIDELSRLFDDAALPDEDRGGLAIRAHALADELEASTELLALLERASAPVRTEVSIGLVVRETSRMSGSASGRELTVRLDDESGECVVLTDPYIVGSLLLLSVGWAHGAGIDAITVRARCSPPTATVVVEAAASADPVLPMIAMRVLPIVPPAGAAARRVADQIGASLLAEEGRWSIKLQGASG